MHQIDYQIGFYLRHIFFTGWANIKTEGDTPYGTEIGNSQYEETGDGHLGGTCTIIVNGDVTGAWHWER